MILILNKHLFCRWFLYPPARQVYSKQHPLLWYHSKYHHLSNKVRHNSWNVITTHCGHVTVHSPSSVYSTLVKCFMSPRCGLMPRSTWMNPLDWLWSLTLVIVRLVIVPCSRFFTLYISAVDDLYQKSMDYCSVYAAGINYGSYFVHDIIHSTQGVYYV